MEVDVVEMDVDYLSIVGHKFYGPRIGAVFVRNLGSKEVPLYPMLYGGGQERNFRPGTENTGMIAGLGKAAELVVQYLDNYSKHMATVRDYLETRLQDVFGDRIHINGKFATSEHL
ncbi:selenocysteine lyase-like [Mizuhopecten yessoensis]|uniref:selenocysteine lyase-like n=1 Tax=Mizuhopecten yessoensis TaxID=6573 RepID=UPI000B457B7C|nr:selenocysteine lyase-like [Mizuhopecten yessoensis]